MVFATDSFFACCIVKLQLSTKVQPERVGRERKRYRKRENKINIQKESETERESQREVFRERITERDRVRERERDRLKRIYIIRRILDVPGIEEVHRDITDHCTKQDDETGEEGMGYEIHLTYMSAVIRQTEIFPCQYCRSTNILASHRRFCLISICLII